MKKTAILLCILALIPLILCSCFKEEVQSVKLSETDVTMTVGDSMEIEASVVPETAEVKAFDWTTSDSKIVTVSDGTLKAKSAGTAVVTAKADDGHKKSCNVTVVDKEITSIILSSTDVSVKEGKKIQLAAKVQPSDAPADGLQWSSSDESVAIVNSEGFVTGVTAGVARIICTAPNGSEASCTVTVKSVEVTNPTSASTAPIQETVKVPSHHYTTITTRNSSPSEIGNAYKGDFVFYDSSYRTLTSSEISRLSSQQVQLAINEIYARYGRVFKDSEVRSYFYSKPWYIENPGFTDSSINSVESANIALLSKYR